MRGLAYRRHQWQRAKERAARYLRWLFAGSLHWVTAKKVARHAVDRTPCSCPMCGNPRRWTGEVTRQEWRAACRCEASEAETSELAVRRRGRS
jgi:hypothetical protein